MYFELPDKKYFSISEVSKLFNVNNSLLRFWEKEFEILKPKVKPSGVRKFTKEDIEKISSIYRLLKEEGLTIQGAKKRLKSKNKESLDSSSIIKKLKDNGFQTLAELSVTPEAELLEIDGIDEVTAKIKQIKNEGKKIDGQSIVNILSVNGIRFGLQDGSWGLIRASSNKPSLVVVTESSTSDNRKKEIFYFIDRLLQETGKIGEYDQKI